MLMSLPRESRILTQNIIIPSIVSASKEVPDGASELIGSKLYADIQELKRNPIRITTPRGTFAFRVSVAASSMDLKVTL